MSIGLLDFGAVRQGAQQGPAVLAASGMLAAVVRWLLAWRRGS